MIGLGSLVVYIFFFEANGNNKFEISRPFKRGRRYSLQDLKIQENLRQDDLKDELLKPVVIDKLKNIEFDDIIIKKNISHLTLKEIESFGLSNKAKDSVDVEIVLEYEQSFFQDIENFHRTLQIGETDINSIPEKSFSVSEVREKSQSIYEVNDVNKTFENALEANVSIDNFTGKIKIKNQCRFFETNRRFRW